MSTLPPCPKCQSEFTYEDGSQLICPECGHEWSAADAAPAEEAAKVWKDANGNILQDGDTVTLGTHTLDVRHCPGHTPGHVVFHSPEMKRAFVGDVLFAGSIGRTDFPGGNHQQLIDSITQRLWPMGDDTVFIPGHGPESSFGEERLGNPYVRGT